VKVIGAVLTGSNGKSREKFKTEAGEKEERIRDERV
jgi:hypothetical protein